MLCCVAIDADGNRHHSGQQGVGPTTLAQHNLYIALQPPWIMAQTIGRENESEKKWTRTVF